MDNMLKSLETHGYLHGFLLIGKGTGTAIMEVTLAHPLAYLEQVVLYGLFLNLRKLFDAIDWGCCLQILKDRGVGPKLCRLIEQYGA